jgi:hypothetical protein
MAKRKKKLGEKAREGLGAVAMSQASGRTAEYQTGRTRTDYTPQRAPEEHPTNIIIGTTRAQDDAAARRKKKLPKTPKPKMGSGNYLSSAKITKR